MKQSSRLILSDELSVSAGSHTMMDLEPATQYNIHVSISNEVNETTMEFTISTTMGRCGCIGHLSCLGACLPRSGVS